MCRFSVVLYLFLHPLKLCNLVLSFIRAKNIMESLYVMLNETCVRQICKLPLQIYFRKSWWSSTMQWHQHTSSHWPGQSNSKVRAANLQSWYRSVTQTIEVTASVWQPGNWQFWYENKAMTASLFLEYALPLSKWRKKVPILIAVTVYK